MIQSLDQNDNIDTIWANFEKLVSQAHILAWNYILLPPFEEQLRASDSEDNNLFPEYLLLGLGSAIDSLPRSDFSRLKQGLRHIEKPILIAHSEYGPQIVTKFEKSGQQVNPHQTFVIPVFGPRALNGCFITTIPDAAKMNNLLSTLCQMTHLRYVYHFLQPAKELTNLSTRECEILQALSHGLSNSKIAESLAISPYTVNGYLQRIFLKIGVQDKTTALLYGFANGLIR